ncbi:HPr(Ser) kinase/phosphatase [PVC group bacterium]|nr:HPr(Ser) kinase/phosphatase [PVC group bacterium]
MPFITITKFYEDQKEELRLRRIGPPNDLERKIKVAEVNRPGLALKGYYAYFASKRIQILGKAEISYLAGLSPKTRKTLLKKFCDFNFPCIVVARRLSIPNELKEVAKAKQIPIFQSSLSTSKISATITFYLEEQFSPALTISGTLMDVYGIGILILGKSGIGKSECALELIKRGHRLVSDDIIHLKLTARKLIVGRRSDIIRHHMEIRGLGIIDIQKIFGIGAIRNQKIVSIIVTLEEWVKNKDYDRLGLDLKTYEILDQWLPHYLVPIRPGRNIAILIEVACSNERLRRMGIDSAKSLEESLLERLASTAKTNTRESHSS